MTAISAPNGFGSDQSLQVFSGFSVLPERVENSSVGAGGNVAVGMQFSPQTFLLRVKSLGRVGAAFRQRKIEPVKFCRMAGGGKVLPLIRRCPATARPPASRRWFFAKASNGSDWRWNKSGLCRPCPPAGCRPAAKSWSKSPRPARSNNVRKSRWCRCGKSRPATARSRPIRRLETVMEPDGIAPDWPAISIVSGALWRRLSFGSRTGFGGIVARIAAAIRRRN